MQQALTNKVAIITAAIALLFSTAFTALAYEDLTVDITIHADNTAVVATYTEDGETVKENFNYDDTDIENIYVYLSDDLEIDQSEVKAAAEVTDLTDEEAAAAAIDDAQSAIDDAETYIASLDASTSQDTIDELEGKVADAQALLDEAQTAFAEDDFDTTEEKASEAQDLADEVNTLADDENDEGDAEDEDKSEEADDGDSSDFCDRTSKAAGWGVAKKCVDDEGYKLNDKMAKKVERSQDRWESKYANYGQTTDRAELQNQLHELLLLLIQLLQQQMALETSS